MSFHSISETLRETKTAKPQQQQPTKPLTMKHTFITLTLLLSITAACGEDTEITPRCETNPDDPSCKPKGPEPDCTDNTACTAANASKCDAGSCTACTADTDCTHLAGTNICNAGTCVECTQQNDTACGTEKTCNLNNNTCDGPKAETLNRCQPCTNSKACNTGLTCAQMQLNNSSSPQGFFCIPLRAEVQNQNCSNARPYLRADQAAQSIESSTVDVCTLALTTCRAVEDFRSKDCGETQPGSDTPQPNNDLCGGDGLNDAFCIEQSPGNPPTYQCTVPCDNINDCPTSASDCLNDPNAARKVCTF